MKKIKRYLKRKKLRKKGLARWWAAPIAWFAWPTTLIGIIHKLPVFLLNPMVHMIVFSALLLTLAYFTASIEPLPNTMTIP